MTTVERIFRALSDGDTALYLRLLRAHLSRLDRMERFLKRLEAGQTRRRLRRAYRSAASVN
jgi:hypothetical protein